MKSRKTLSNPIIKRVTLSIALAFILFGVIIWLFFQTSARNIGLALFSGNKETAFKLIENYIGDPPSKIKASILSRMYGMHIIYEIDGKIKWLKGPPPPPENTLILQMHRQMHGMGMMGMRQRIFEDKIYLESGGSLTIYIPLRVNPQRYFYPQFLIFLLIIVAMGTIVFLFLRKTLNPLNEIIKASERIGMGDLSYRIEYPGNDEFRRVADAFNKMASKLGTVLTLQREMLHVISHELRTPLARMALAAEMKNKDKAVTVIKNEINEINSLIEQVLVLSRINYEENIKTTENIEIESLVKEITLPFKKRVLINGSTNKLTIKSNGFLLKKIISNIVENAVKYSPPDSKIEINIFTEDTKVVIRVRNSGPGIPQEELDKIWEPFYRGSSSKVYSAEGKGLGLVIAKKAVEILGGNIEVKSSAEGPTTFVLRIPGLNKSS